MTSEADPSPNGEFAPTDPTDGRRLGEWESRYPRTAWRSISLEAAYVCALFLFVPIATILIWEGSFREFLDVSAQRYETISLYAYSSLGGLLGGVLFDLKWLYHSVARGRWHRDRRLWRLFTPPISAGLAFAVILLGTGGVLPLIDGDQLRSPPAAMGVSFLVGYFSDLTIGSMASLAKRILRRDGGADKAEVAVESSPSAASSQE